MKARVIVADDHDVVRQGLRDMISRTADLKVVATAADGLEAERLARTGEAEVLVLDVALPGKRGVQVLESLRAEGCRLPVLLFSIYPAAQYVDYARKAGAQGFVMKSASGRELLHALREIVAGRTAFPARAARGQAGVATADPFAALSRREADVMRGLLAGEGLAEIGARLGIGAKSVTTYRRRLLDKLGVRSNAELAGLAARHGQI